MPSDSKKLGIIAGAGQLPRQLVAACRNQGRDFFVLALSGHASPELVDNNIPHAWIRVGEAAQGFDILHDNNVAEVVMAGAVSRPRLSDLLPDWRTTRFIARLGMKGFGDDGLLKALIAEFETENFKVVGIQSILEPLLAVEGSWGKNKPDQQAMSDINQAIDVGIALGKVDVGQAVVVQNGIVLGVEAAEGTDALITRTAAYRRDGGGGVLVKLMKPGQECRADLPTIGIRTVQLCAESGFCGIAVEAGSSLVIDRDAMIVAADRAGLFLYGFMVAKG